LVLTEMASENGSVRVDIRISEEVAAYLDQLTLIGIHGKTRSEVARTLIGYEIERLIREGIVKLREPKEVG